MFILLVIDINVLMQSDTIPVFVGSTLDEIRELLLEDEEFEYEPGEIDPDLDHFLENGRSLKPGNSVSIMADREVVYQLTRP